MKYISLVFGFMVFIGHLPAQNCSINKIRDIPDNNKPYSIQLEANTQSSGSKILCGVRLTIEHEYVDELRFLLVSPSGKELTLMEGKTSSSNTTNSSWSILFQRNEETPHPDLFKQDKWGENSWEKDKNYVGAYHPDDERGLELFDGDRMNGVWNLIYQDRAPGGKGTLKSFQLLFCDNSTICMSCDISADFMVTESPRSYCGGDPRLQDVQPAVQPSALSSGFDHLFFAFDSRGAVVDHGKQINLSSHSAGNYSISGIQFRKENQNLITEATTRSELADLIGGLKPSVCGVFSSSTQEVIILSDPKPKKIVQEIYGRDFIVIDGRHITSDETVVQDLKDKNGCDSIVHIDIQFKKYTAPFTQNHLYDCDHTMISLGVNNSKNFPIYRWYTKDGIISNQSDLRSNEITVEAPGKYFVIFEIEDYLDTISHELNVDPNTPVFTMNNEYRMCYAGGFDIQIGRNFDKATVDPGSTATISGKILTVTEPGLYTIRLQKGDCILFKTILILPPPTTSNVEIPNQMLTCADQPVTLRPVLTEKFDHYVWIYKDQEIGSTKDLSIDQAGYYTFRAFDDGECGVTGTVWVEDQTKPINLKIEGPDLVHCLNKDKDPKLNAIFQGSHNPKWTDPKDNLIPGNTIPISEPGRYKVEITDDDGCIHTAEKNIHVDTTPININVPDEVTIGCQEESASIQVQVSSSTTDYSVQWKGAQQGTDPLTASSQNPGIVQVEVTDRTSRCSAVGTIKVKLDPRKPELTFDKNAARSITCDTPIRNLRVSIEQCNGNDCEITDDSDSEITLNDDMITAQAPGTITITMDNGTCHTTQIIEFSDETEARKLDLQTENIGCSEKPGKIHIKNADQYASILLKSDKETISYDKSALTLSNPESFDIVYIDKSNGCVDSIPVNIESDETLPEVEFDPVSYLNCHSGEAILSVKGNGITRLVWQDSEGNNIESESLKVDKPGKYTFIAFNQELCFQEKIIEVIDDRTPPKPGFQSTYLLPCSGTEEGIKVSYDTSGLKNTQWYGPGGFTSTDFQPLLLTTGRYVVTLTGKNGCTTTEEIHLEQETFNTPPSIQAASITCKKTSSLVHLSHYTDLKEVQWIDESGQSSRQDTFEVFNPGRITVSIKNNAGCRTTQEYNLKRDVDQVPFNINKPVIDCNDPTPAMKVTLGENAVTSREIFYEWQQDGQKISGMPEIQVQIPAVYKVKVGYDNGCTDSLSHEVLADTIKPQMNVLPDTLNCRQSKIQLREEIKTDGIVSAEWTGPQNFTSTDIRPIFTIPGHYSATYSSSNGCSRTTRLHIIDDLAPPNVDSVDFASLGCNGKEVPLRFYTNDSIIEQYWLHPNGSTVDQAVIDITTAGEYILHLKGENYCSSVDTFLIDEKINPKFDIEIEDADCLDHMGSAIALPLRDTFTTLWEDPATGRELARGHMSPPLAPGAYQVTVTNPVNHCDSTFYFEVRDIAEILEVEIAIDDSMRCEKTTTNLISTVFPASDHYIYSWKINKRNEIISQDSIAADISEEGRYTLTLTDTVNYCTIEKTYLNVKAKSTLKKIDLFLKEPACDIDQPGIAIIDSVRGALEMDQMEYSLNGSAYHAQDTFPFLYANEPYRISARDQYGCQLDTLLLLELRGIMDRIGSIKDTLINSGDTLNLNDPAFRIEYASTDAPMAEKYSWTLNPDIFSCDFPCDEEVNILLQETRFGTALLTNEYGCTMQDTFHIYVRESEILNVPTGIIPSSSQQDNAHACIYTNQYISRIDLYVIFDQQGSIVYRRSEFDPRKENELFENCWDGRDHSGNIMPQGHYNYYISYHTVYGASKEKYGNLFLLR